jgi:hypothetical protein
MSTADWFRHHDHSPYCYRTYPVLVDAKGERDVCPCGWMGPKEHFVFWTDWWDDQELADLERQWEKDASAKKPTPSFTLGEIISHNLTRRR